MKKKNQPDQKNQEKVNIESTLEWIHAEFSKRDNEECDLQSFIDIMVTSKQI